MLDRLTLEGRSQGASLSLHLFGVKQVVEDGIPYVSAEYFYSPAPISRRLNLVNKERDIKAKLTVPITPDMADQLMQGIYLEVLNDGN